MDEPIPFDVCENQHVNAPTCPTCGYVLRWFATHNAWGCDRCQALVPGSPLADRSQPSPYAPPIPTAVTDHPSQPYVPPGYPVPVTDAPSQPIGMPREPYSPYRPPSTPATAAAPPGKSRKGLVIGLAVLAVAIAGVVIAVVVAGGGDGGRSRDDVIKQTFAALASGSDDKLYELADPKHVLEKVVRCEKQADTDDDSELSRRVRVEADYRDPAKIEARWKKDVSPLIRRTKGTKIEVVDILTEMPPPIGTKPKKSSRDRDREDDEDEDDERRRDKDLDFDRFEDEEDRPERDREFKTTTYRKGNVVMPGCYAKMPFRSQLVNVAVDIKEGERELTQRVKVMLYEIDGKWYLTAPPHLNVGFDVLLTDLQEWRDKLCKCTDATCVEHLDEEYGQLSYAQYAFDRKADMPRDMVKRIEKVQSERRVCEGLARGGPELAKYKELKDRVCACTDEDCSRKLELEMMDLRQQIETTARRSRDTSYEVTRQVSEIALQANECTRKLSLLRVRVYSAYPSSGELAGGTPIMIRGGNFTASARTAKVWFGTKEATNVRILNDREIFAEVPPSDVEGLVTVRVELTPGGSHVLPYGYTYRAPLKPKSTRPRPKKSTTLPL